MKKFLISSKYPIHTRHSSNRFLWFLAVLSNWQTLQSSNQIIKQLKANNYLLFRHIKNLVLVQKVQNKKEDMRNPVFFAK